MFDMNVGQSVRVVMDAHSRTVHTICQNEVDMLLIGIIIFHFLSDVIVALNRLAQRPKPEETK